MWAIEPKYDKVPRAYETLYPGLTTYLQRPKFWSLNFSFYNIQVLMNNDHMLTATTDLGAKGCSFAVYIFKCVFSPSRYVFRCHSSETGSKPILFFFFSSSQQSYLVHPTLAAVRSTVATAL